jgi:hypothetical protein
VASQAAPEYRYSAYGIGLHTNLPMPGLPTAPPGDEQVRFVLGEPRAAQAGASPEWYHRYLRRRNGAPWLSCAYRLGGVLLRDHVLADFHVSHPRWGPTDILCSPEEGAGPDALRETFLYPVLPLVLNLRGTDALHASAVEIGGECVAFTGLSGVGKSTLAAYLHTRGYPVVTDDCLPLHDRPGGVYAGPGLSELRVDDNALGALEGLEGCAQTTDVLSDKRILAVPREPGSSGRESLPLRRVYVVVEKDAARIDRGVRLERLPGRRAFLPLMEQSFRLELYDPGMLRRQARLFGRVVAEGRVRLLTVGWGFDLLPRAVERILEDLCD